MKNLLILLTLPFLASCATKSYVMPVDAMSPTIVAGNRIKVDTKAYEDVEPALGDLVMFQPSLYQERLWVFRIAALPGDVLAYRNGNLTRNGEPITSPAFGDHKGYGPAPGSDIFARGRALKLDDYRYFMLSDDPRHYNDSRMWGSIPRVDIFGKVVNFD